VDRRFCRSVICRIWHSFDYFAL